MAVDGTISIAFCKYLREIPSIHHRPPFISLSRLYTFSTSPSSAFSPASPFYTNPTPTPTLRLPRHHAKKPPAAKTLQNSGKGRGKNNAVLAVHSPTRDNPVPPCVIKTNNTEKVKRGGIKKASARSIEAIGAGNIRGKKGKKKRQKVLALFPTPSLIDPSPVPSGRDREAGA